jgi:hypothetical protein
MIVFPLDPGVEMAAGEGSATINNLEEESLW